MTDYPLAKRWCGVYAAHDGHVWDTLHGKYRCGGVTTLGLEQGAPITAKARGHLARWEAEGDIGFGAGSHEAPVSKGANMTREPGAEEQADEYRTLHDGDEREHIGHPHYGDKCMTADAADAVVVRVAELVHRGQFDARCGDDKGKMGYWNKIRVDFPETFQIRSRQERDLDHAMIHDATGPVFLDELDPDRGDYGAEPDIDCSLLCAITNDEIEDLPLAAGGAS